MADPVEVQKVGVGLRAAELHLSRAQDKVEEASDHPMWAQYAGPIVGGIKNVRAQIQTLLASQG